MCPLFPNCSSEAVTPSMRLKASTHPSALPSDELVIFSLDAGSAASVVVLLLKVRVILELLRCLGKTNNDTYLMYSEQQSSFTKKSFGFVQHTDAYRANVKKHLISRSGNYLTWFS